jgi:hypothetical protein
MLSLYQHPRLQNILLLCGFPTLKFTVDMTLQSDS